MNHLGHRRHRVARREALAKAGTNQQITLFDICGIGHMAQFQAFRVAGTASNGAQAIAIDLNWNAVGGVGKQQHPRRIGHDFHHLAHQAARIEHRLAEEDAVFFAFVDKDALGERIGIDANQLADQHLVIHQCRGVEQLTQAHVLFGQGRQLLQATLQQQGFGLELFVLGEQFAMAAELLSHPLPQTHRQVGQPVNRRQHQAELAAHRFEGVETRVHQHQRHRQHGQHQQANTQ